MYLDMLTESESEMSAGGFRHPRASGPDNSKCPCRRCIPGPRLKRLSLQARVQASLSPSWALPNTGLSVTSSSIFIVLAHLLLSIPIAIKTNPF